MDPPVVAAARFKCRKDVVGAAHEPAYMGKAGAFGEALLRPAERVSMDGYPGLARSRTEQRNVGHAGLVGNIRPAALRIPEHEGRGMPRPYDKTVK